MAGTVVADTFQSSITGTPPQFNDGVGTQIGTLCRAWVNFNGTTVTNPASMTGVRASFNVSSILDNGTGDYTVNFTTAMPDANYAFAATSLGAGAGNVFIGVEQNQATAPTTSALRILVKQSATAIDRTIICVSIFR